MEEDMEDDIEEEDIEEDMEIDMDTMIPCLEQSKTFLQLSTVHTT